MSQHSSDNCCAVCGGRKVDGATTFTAELGYGVVVIRHVPALVCEQCGADWLADETAARVEELVNAAREKRAEVEVLAYS